jgi:hypothetical protein
MAIPFEGLEKMYYVKDYQPSYTSNSLAYKVLKLSPAQL